MRCWKSNHLDYYNVLRNSWAVQKQSKGNTQNQDSFDSNNRCKQFPENSSSHR